MACFPSSLPGTDPLLRLYDRRMLPLPSDGHGSRSKAPQWVSCYIPAHLKADLWDSRPTASPALGAAAGAGYQLTAVAFARGGTEVVGSYTGHGIYSFDSVEHARDVESLLHIPETVLRWVVGWRRVGWWVLEGLQRVG